MTKTKKTNYKPLDEVKGYKIIGVKTTSSSDATHWIMVKEHSVRDWTPEKPPERTLFVLGTPPFVTEECYKNAFGAFGSVSDVYFHSTPTAAIPQLSTSKFFQDSPQLQGYKVAYVVFSEPNAVRSVMASTEPLILYKNDIPSYFGLKKYCKEYNESILEKEPLMKEVNEFIEKYDKMTEEAEVKAREDREPDEDGWTTVTKKSRKPGIARKESVVNKIMKKESVKKQKKQLLNFYRFQIRESKMNHLVKLREKFEEDKKKIASLKQSRKFKPFS